MEKKEMKKSGKVAKDNPQYVPVVDGGWGWVVVVGSFFIHVFADGIVYSFGILLEIIMKEFGASNTKASVIISLLTGLTLGMGPIASAITNKFGCRVTTILGSLIATVGCAASRYATSVEYLMGSVGCVMGIGFGLMYCPAIVIVTMYFEKKRAMATGMAVCGAGVGTVIFARISQLLLQFSWRTVFTVYAVFVRANITVPTPAPHTAIPVAIALKFYSIVLANKMLASSTVFALVFYRIVLMCSLCGATFRPLTFVAVEDETEKKKVVKVNEKNGSVEMVHQHLDEEKAPLSATLLSPSQQNATVNEKDEKRQRSESLTKDNPRRRSRRISESTGFITVKDVFYTGSMSELPQDEHYRSLASLNIKDDKLESLEEIVMNQEEEEKTSKARGIWRTVEKMTDISLLANPIFLLYAISNLLTSIAFNAPLVFLPSHATNVGLTSSQSANIISAFGFLNTIGRILVGIISDRKLPCKYGKDTARNRFWTYVSSLCICGLLTAAVLFCDTYISLAAYSSLFGLTLSSYVCLTSVLLVDLIGIEKLTNAFGLILLFQGIGTIIGPPISGRIADLTGSYDMSFVFCGVALLISGLMLVIVPGIQHKQTMKKLKSSAA